MKRLILNSKTALLIPLVIVAVIYDSFTTGIHLFPSPILSFLQGFLLIAAPAAICWIVARKIQFYNDKGYLRIEINYGKSKLTINDKIY
ncbi:MAG TPA: hypothetical protein VLC28_01550 [Flavitalea sp.]|nr:hypothetical protein [Flavitalea sp.]